MAAPDVVFTRLEPDGVTEIMQPLRRELGVTAFGINLMVLEPGRRMRIHTHERQEEVYLVVDGELTLRVEGGEHVLRRGDAARVGPGVRRQLANGGAERVVLVALGGAGEHDPRDALAWSTWDEGGPGRPPQEVPLPPYPPAR